ncbi:hypothetical protein [Burkholderia plantarii]|uniref:Uncharacterized protein n=1 Tax=Burkholderia plantarii TaxID=41899 RepID=A0A0B6S4V4_BURPL|nr:hypothetical protein [Burkholderia plantarii]AJK49409.1 hypothetical protein BGL_2c13420 [Burkholderia plantarii]WLE62673.1 hypothetical protein GIY62_19950 [Burkholderia plantarii]
MPNPYRHLCLILAATLAAALGAPAARAQESVLPAAMFDGLAAQAPLAGVRDLPLDETTLASQRGRAAGMTMMVSATPMMLAGARNTVTLWDEIAPPALPAPLPMPADAPRPMQGNSLSMTRR